MNDDIPDSGGPFRPPRGAPAGHASRTRWPAPERPREKLLLRGAAALSEAELLAILWRTGRRGQPAVDFAREQLAGSGGLRDLLQMPRAAFLARPGLGPARYAELHGAIELARRLFEAAVREGDVMRDPDTTSRWVRSRLVAYPMEVFAVLFLDRRNRVIAFEELFRGTVDSASVYPREVVREALNHNAVSVILAHNHPSGAAEPSTADVRITRRIRDALRLVDIELLDHLVIGAGEPVSLAARGLL